MTSRLMIRRLLLSASLLGSFALGESLAQTPAATSPATTSATPAKKPDLAAEGKLPAKPAKNSEEPKTSSEPKSLSELKSSLQPKSPSEIDAQDQTDREAAAWGFVMTHHPQLGEVLSRLKIMHLGQYEKAINQITLAAERISRMQKADPKRGELELEDWKLGSQIQLAAAKLSLAREDAELQQELGKIVRKQLEHRLKVTEFERDRVAARLKVLDEQAAKQKETLANMAELRVNEMLREITKTRKNLQAENNNPKKPAKSKPAE
jgi:hypothetical protein